jgi:hypothetical protein
VYALAGVPFSWLWLLAMRQKRFMHSICIPSSGTLRVYFPWMLHEAEHIVCAIPNANIRSTVALLWYNYKIIHLGVLRPLLGRLYLFI